MERGTMERADMRPEVEQFYQHLRAGPPEKAIAEHRDLYTNPDETDEIIRRLKAEIGGGAPELAHTLKLVKAYQLWCTQKVVLAVRGDQTIKLKPEVEALLARFEEAEEGEEFDRVIAELMAIDATDQERCEIALRINEITENMRIDALVALEEEGIVKHAKRQIARYVEEKVATGELIDCGGGKFRRDPNYIPPPDEAA
jgi:hypothetical protein